MTKREDQMFMAASEGDLAAVNAARAAGVDLHAKNESALGWAATNGHVEIVDFLIAAGADVHAADDAALHYAAVWGHIEVVQHLLAVGADIHASHDGPLRAAATGGQTEMVCLLLAAGADPVMAWSKVDPSERDIVADTLDACADAMTPAQRTALVARSKKFRGLAAMNRSLRHHASLRR